MENKEYIELRRRYYDLFNRRAKLEASIKNTSNILIQCTLRADLREVIDEMESIMDRLIKEMEVKP